MSGKELIPAFIVEDLIEDQVRAFCAHWPIFPLQRDRLAAIAAVSLQFLGRAHFAFAASFLSIGVEKCPRIGVQN